MGQGTPWHMQLVHCPPLHNHTAWEPAQHLPDTCEWERGTSLIRTWRPAIEEDVRVARNSRWYASLGLDTEPQLGLLVQVMCMSCRCEGSKVKMISQKVQSRACKQHSVRAEVEIHSHRALTITKMILPWLMPQQCCYSAWRVWVWFCPADGSSTTLSLKRFCCYHHWYVIRNMEVQDLNCQSRNNYSISCAAKCGLSRKLQGSKFFTISSQMLTLPMEAVLFKMAPFSNKFYGALERQVRDQIQHKHCDHVTSSQTPSKKIHCKWSTESRSYTLTERKFACICNEFHLCCSADCSEHSHDSKPQ